MMKRVVISGATFPPDLERQLRVAGLQPEYIDGHLGKDEVARRLDGAWGYVLGGNERMTSEVWQGLPDLAVVVVLGTGYRMFIQPPEHPTKTVFAYTPHANAEAVAEFTVGLALDAVRQVTAKAEHVRRGEWVERMTGTLLGARVGIAGMGHVGRHVARILATGFGARVRYWNRTARPELERDYTSAPSVLDLCRDSDVLILTMAYELGGNDGLFGAAQLAALPEGAVLVSIAGAGLVDPAALRAALESGALSAAAFDGYYQEPAPHDDELGLLALYPRFIATPHCAYNTDQATRRMAEMGVQNLVAVANGGAAAHPIPDEAT